MGGFLEANLSEILGLLFHGLFFSRLPRTHLVEKRDTVLIAFRLPTPNRFVRDSVKREQDEERSKRENRNKTKQLVGGAAAASWLALEQSGASSRLHPIPNDGISIIFSFGRLASRVIDQRSEFTSSTAVHQKSPHEQAPSLKWWNRDASRTTISRL